MVPGNRFYGFITFKMDFFVYNGHKIKKREVLYHFSPATSSTLFIFVNHPFAYHGAGWFFCFLERFSERNMHQLYT
jgi:hypothetical protein